MELEPIDDHLDDKAEGSEEAVDRSLLQLLAKHADFKTEDLKLTFRKANLFPSEKAWLWISSRFFMGGGLLLVLSGIIYFFAFNWNDLHKFAKLGIVEGAIILISLLILLVKMSDFVRKLGITAVSVLVGVASAVFGQIYQTGADAYDFFLGWTLFVTVWVILASFPILWLFYIALVNITVLLYVGQIHLFWEGEVLHLIVVMINLVALVAWEWAAAEKRQEWVHLWAVRILGTVVVYALTNMTLYGLFHFDNLIIWPFFLYVPLVSIIGYYYSNQEKDIVFVTVLGISLLVMGNSIIIRGLDGIDDFIGFAFLLSFLNMAATSGLVFYLIALNKRWNQKIEKDA